MALSASSNSDSAAAFWAAPASALARAGTSAQVAHVSSVAHAHRFRDIVIAMVEGLPSLVLRREPQLEKVRTARSHAGKQGRRAETRGEPRGGWTSAGRRSR